MRSIVLTLFLLVFLVAFSSRSFAQECNGSLGDPVINQDFGSGQNPGAPLAPGVTTMTYTSNNCPDDGSYTIANSLTGIGNCHQNSWHNVTSDHTGNPNGYMMIVNASETPSVFFTQTASGLCPSTTYEFSAYILNLITLEASGPGVSEPNITFTVTTTAGVPLAPPLITGTIAPTEDNHWYKDSVYFTLPANITDVVVTMTNNAPGGNGNDLILDDITFRACGPIIKAGFDDPAIGATMPVCQGFTGPIELKASVAGNAPSYQWQVNGPGGWTDILNATATDYTAQFNNAPVGSYQYRLGVSNGQAISVVSCRVYSQPLTIEVNPLPVVPPITVSPVCEGDPLILTATGAASYTWSGPNLPPTIVNPLIIQNAAMNNAGTYKVVGMSAENCPSPDVFVNVTVLPRPVATVQSNVAALCEGESAQLTATGGSIYTWTPTTGLNNPSIPNPVATPLQTTTYTAHVGNGSCVDSSKSVTITVNINPIANAGNPIVLFEGQSAKLNGTVTGDNIVSFSWAPTTFLSDPASLTPITTPTDNITYTLTVQSKTCGQSSSSVYVRVYKKITIPNAFSPNNDGVNDFWNIDALVTYPDCSVSVFDRYGQRVYQSTGYSKSWDGTEEGKALPEGTYYYVIDLKNGTPKISGWVLIVR